MSLLLLDREIDLAEFKEKGLCPNSTGILPSILYSKNHENGFKRRRKPRERKEMTIPAHGGVRLDFEIGGRLIRGSSSSSPFSGSRFLGDFPNELAKAKNDRPFHSTNPKA